MSNFKTSNSLPWACLLGDLSMVRALGKSGIPVAVATVETSRKSTRSRYCGAVIEIPGWQQDPVGTVTALTRWAEHHDSRPVLFYQTDLDVVWVSRFRDKLAERFRFVLPPSELVEDLVDKSKFYERAVTWHIPIPETQIITDTRSISEQCNQWTKFPCILKPIIRTATWHRTVTEGKKALHINNREELEARLNELQVDSTSLVLQEKIFGGEQNVLSYHAYVRESLEVVMEFTGRKIRTSPRQYGSSSYLEITENEEVRDLGRSIIKELGFHGVLKIDFKRDERSGKLFVLEINPRFNLWHHLGSVAGASIPEAVYWDCVDPSRVSRRARARQGVRWMRPRKDIQAYREYRDAGEISVIRWLCQALTVDVNEGFQFSDLAPTIHEFLQLFRRGNDSDRAALDEPCKLR